MKDRTSVVTAIIISLLLGRGEMFAQKLASNAGLELGIDPAPESIRLKNMRISHENDVPLAWYHVDYQVRAGDPQQAAREFLKENADTLRIQNDLNDLRLKGVVETPGGYHVRFEQFVGEYPVYESGIVVTINRRNFVTFVASSYQPLVEIELKTPALEVQAAEQIAMSHLQIDDAVNSKRSRLVYYHRYENSRLSYQVSLSPSGAPFGDWEILIDASSGELFRVEDKAYYYFPRFLTSNPQTDGTGRVFDPDPLTRANAVYGDPGFTDSNDADSPQLISQIVSRSLNDITFDGSLYHLDGPYASIVDFEFPFNGVYSQPSDQFLFTRSQDGFEAVNVYFHLDQSMRYINGALGFSLSPYQYNGGVEADPHGLSGADNSYYSSGTGQLAFGEGGVDDAEDVDVILHELGHGIHDWLTLGQLSQVDGLSEGCGDYWAASYNRSLGFWQNSDPQYHWVFQWDGHNPFWPGRMTNYTATYPGGLTGQIHTDGQMWSSTLMQIHDDIGRQATDTNFLEALAMLNNFSNQEDAAQAFIQADIDLHSGANLGPIVFWFQQRGYEVTVPAPNGSIFFSPDLMNESLSPGDTSIQQLTITNVGIAGSILEFSIAVSEAWLGVDPAAGSLASNQSAIIEVTFDATDLAAGGYNATIEIASNDSTNSLVSIPVTLNVAGGSLDKLGDVNDDGGCNSADALIILSYDIGIPIPPDYLDRIDSNLGDIDSNGETNSTDALILLSFDAGMPVMFPVCQALYP